MGRPKDWKKKEKWRYVEGHGKWYSVSNMGRVRSNMIKRVGGAKRKRTVSRKLLKPGVSHGVAHTNLYCLDRDMKPKNVQIKDLVADHWLRPRTPGAKVYLVDTTDLLDCSVYNIRERNSTRNRNQKLTIDEIREIKMALQNYKRGDIAALARKYRVSESAVQRIKTGERWADV